MKHSNQGFKKKIYSLELLMSDLKFLFNNRSTIKQAMHNPKLGKKFMEKVMTVVTAVNGCVYCTWFHAKQAASTGIPADEVKRLLQLQFNTDASDFEVTALLYAQHYAETDRHPNPEMTEKFESYYGNETASHIFMMIRMIYFGNLTGNTFDAFISRLKGKKAENSNWFFETVFFIVNIPFLLPILPLTRKYRSNETE